jgi:hypothetical protein
MIETIKIKDRVIVIAGIGKLFYQHGLPIAISITELNKKNIEVSLFHIADECLKNGWSSKTTYVKLTHSLEDDISKVNFDSELLYEFCHADYETQREMIFKYLFDDDEVGAIEFCNSTLPKGC